MKTFSASRPFRTLKNLLPLALLALSLLPASRAAEAPARGIRVVGVQQAGQSTAGNAALFVGVNNFRDEDVQPLRYAVNDAVAQAHLFVLQLQLIPARNTVLLVSGEPSTPAAQRQLAALRDSGVRISEALRSELLRELRWVSDRATGPTDLLLASISSHGFEDGAVPYILPTDGLLSDLAENGLSLKAVETRLEKSKAGTRLLIVDACRERPTTAAKNLGSGMKDAWRQALGQGYGQAALASCDVGQFSFEDAKLGHGVFTYHLLEALNGKAAGDARGFITLGAVSDYVTDAVNDWVLRNRRSANRETAQKPWFKGPNEARRVPLAIKLAGLPPVEDPPPVPTGPASATKEKPWVNTLGMKFVPVAGTEVLFSVWETRVQDYAAFASATSREMEKPPFEQGPTHPVVEVSWDDAQAFAKWLTEKERREGTLTAGQSYRLPQDWEWSVAVGLNEAWAKKPYEKQRATKDVYPWGTQWPPPQGVGNYSSSLNVDSFAYTSPAGSFAANRFGLFDLGGNAWEWCEDFYHGTSGARVLRGGSWYNYDSDLLLSSSRGDTADGNVIGIGFRCVLVGVSSR